jgi:hypothetical protein
MIGLIGTLAEYHHQSGRIAPQGRTPGAGDGSAGARTAALVDPEGESLAQCLADIDSASARRLAAEQRRREGPRLSEFPLPTPRTP